METKKTIAVIIIMILIYGYAPAQHWNLVGNAGTSSITNFLGTTDNVDLKLRTNNAVRMVVGKSGTVSIGTAASSLAKFTTSGAVGNNTAIFGTGAAGISLQQSYPGISFNSYYTAGYKALAAGYGANFTVDPTNGTLHYRSLSNGAAAGSAQTYTTPLVITRSGNVGINNMSPAASVDLQVGQSTGDRIQIGDQSQLVDMGNMILDVSSSFRPTADNAYQLGGSQNRWTSVWSADGSINTSDRRDKSNIRDIKYGLSEVLKLHPVIYSWKDAPERGEKLGLIAQELQLVIKEAVVSKTFTTEPNGNKLVTENERLGVYYGDLVPVMIKAIQEQQQQIDNKDAKIQSLEDQLKITNERLNKIEQSLNAAKSGADNAWAPDVRLYQNTPNPFSDKSVIRFYIPARVNNAELKIFSSDGKEVNKFRIVTRGENKIDIAAGMLPAGIYSYTLFIDGRVGASRQMIIASAR